MKRIPVDIKWNEEKQAFAPYEVGTDKPIKQFSYLTYGQTDSAIIKKNGKQETTENARDIPEESIKTFKDPSISRGKYRDSSPNKTIILKGFVTV